MPTGEVGFVAAVVLGGVPAIAAAWAPILKPAGYSVEMTGVFCHKTPEASFTDSSGISRNCELADLLIVVDDVTSGAPTGRWAVLIQAKTAAPGGGQTITKRRELTQLELLSNWPPFELPTNFPPGKRDFSSCSHPGAPIDCARYGLIGGQPNPIWHQQAPAPTMPAGGSQLGTFLANMIEDGQTSYGRKASGTADDWSRTVSDLLIVSAGLVFKYAQGFKSLQARRTTSMALVVVGRDDLGSPWSSWGKGDIPPYSGRPDGIRDEDEDPGEGISVLHIGISRLSD